MFDKVTFQPDKFGSYTFFSWAFGLFLGLGFYNFWFLVMAFVCFALQMMSFAQRNSIFREND